MILGTFNAVLVVKMTPEDCETVFNCYKLAWLKGVGHLNSIIRNSVVTPLHKAVLYEQRVRVAVRGS